MGKGSRWWQQQEQEQHQQQQKHSHYSHYHAKDDATKTTATTITTSTTATTLSTPTMTNATSAHHRSLALTTATSQQLQQQQQQHQTPQQWVRRAIILGSCTSAGRQRQRSKERQHAQQQQLPLSSSSSSVCTNRRSNSYRNLDEDELVEEDEDGHVIVTRTAKKVMNPTWNSLLFSYQFADVMVQCSDESTLPAHKNILAAASPTLLAHQLVLPPKITTMIPNRKNNKQQQQQEFIYWKVPYPTYVMRAVLSFIYLGPSEPLHVRLMQHEPWTLWKVAHEFQLVSLLQELHQAKLSQQQIPIQHGSLTTMTMPTTATTATTNTNPPKQILPEMGETQSLQQQQQQQQQQRRQRSHLSTTTSLTPTTKSSSSVSTYHIPVPLNCSTHLIGSNNNMKLPKGCLMKPKYTIKNNCNINNEDDDNTLHDESRGRWSHLYGGGDSVVSPSSSSSSSSSSALFSDDDDDASSAASTQVWLSALLVSPTDMCRPANQSMNSSIYSRPVSPEYALGRPSFFWRNDKDEDDYLFNKDDDDHNDNETEDPDDDDDDEGDYYNDDEDYLGPLPPRAESIRHQDSMSDLTPSPRHRDRSYRKMQQQKQQKQIQQQQKQQQWQNMESSSSPAMPGCVINQLDLVNNNNDNPKLLMPSPPPPSDQDVSKSGIVLLVPTSNNDNSDNLEPHSTAFIRTRSTQQHQFRDKYERRMGNDRYECDRYQPRLESPPLVLQEHEHWNYHHQHQHQQKPQYAHHEQPTTGPDYYYSPDTSMNMDKIELLNVETINLDLQQQRHQQQQQQQQVTLIIRGPSMTLPTSTASAPPPSPTPTSVAKKGRVMVDREASIWEMSIPNEDHDHGAPALVSPLSAELPSPPDNECHDLSPPRIQRVVTNDKLRNGVDCYMDDSNVTMTSPNKPAIANKLSNPSRWQQVRQPQPQPSPAAVPRVRLRDDSVDSKMVALVLSRFEEQQQQIQQQNSFTLSPPPDDTDHDGMEQELKAFMNTTDNASVKDEDNVEVTISTKIDHHDDPPEPIPPLSHNLEPKVVTRKDMIRKIRRVVALYKKPMVGTTRISKDD